MKRNVDLTEDRVFDERLNQIRYIKNIFDRLDKFKSKAKNFTKQSNTSMLMGNKHERKYASFCSGFGIPTDSCDQCGKKIKMPWKRGYGGLCNECGTRNDE